MKSMMREMLMLLRGHEIANRVPKADQEAINRIGKLQDLCHYVHMWTYRSTPLIVIVMAILFPSTPMFILAGIYCLILVAEVLRVLFIVIGKRMTKRVVEKVLVEMEAEELAKEKTRKEEQLAKEKAQKEQVEKAKMDKQSGEQTKPNIPSPNNAPQN